MASNPIQPVNPATGTGASGMPAASLPQGSTRTQPLPPAFDPTLPTQPGPSTINRGEPATDERTFLGMLGIPRPLENFIAENNIEIISVAAAAELGIIGYLTAPHLRNRIDQYINRETVETVARQLATRSPNAVYDEAFMQRYLGANFTNVVPDAPLGSAGAPLLSDAAADAVPSRFGLTEIDNIISHLPSWMQVVMVESNMRINHHLDGRWLSGQDAYGLYYPNEHSVVFSQSTPDPRGTFLHEAPGHGVDAAMQRVLAGSQDQFTYYSEALDGWEARSMALREIGLNSALTPPDTRPYRLRTSRTEALTSFLGRYSPTGQFSTEAFAEMSRVYVTLSLEHPNDPAQVERIMRAYEPELAQLWYERVIPDGERAASLLQERRQTLIADTVEVRRGISETLGTAFDEAALRADLERMPTAQIDEMAGHLDRYRTSVARVQNISVYNLDDAANRSVVRAYINMYAQAAHNSGIRDYDSVLAAQLAERGYARAPELADRAEYRLFHEMYESLRVSGDPVPMWNRLDQLQLEDVMLRPVSPQEHRMRELLTTLPERFGNGRVDVARTLMEIAQLSSYGEIAVDIDLIRTELNARGYYGRQTEGSTPDELIDRYINDVARDPRLAVEADPRRVTALATHIDQLELELLQNVREARSSVRITSNDNGLRLHFGERGLDVDALRRLAHSYGGYQYNFGGERIAVIPDTATNRQLLSSVIDSSRLLELDVTVDANVDLSPEPVRSVTPPDAPAVTAPEAPIVGSDPLAVRPVNPDVRLNLTAPTLDLPQGAGITVTADSLAPGTRLVTPNVPDNLIVSADPLGLRANLGASPAAGALDVTIGPVTGTSPAIDITGDVPHSRGATLTPDAPVSPRLRIPAAGLAAELAIFAPLFGGAVEGGRRTFLPTRREAREMSPDQRYVTGFEDGVVGALGIPQFREGDIAGGANAVVANFTFGLGAEILPNLRADAELPAVMSSRADDIRRLRSIVRPELAEQTDSAHLQNLARLQAGMQRGDRYVVLRGTWGGGLAIVETSRERMPVIPSPDGTVNTFSIPIEEFAQNEAARFFQSGGQFEGPDGARAAFEGNYSIRERYDRARSRIADIRSPGFNYLEPELREGREVLDQFIRNEYETQRNPSIRTPEWEQAQATLWNNYVNDVGEYEAYSRLRRSNSGPFPLVASPSTWASAGYAQVMELEGIAGEAYRSDAAMWSRNLTRISNYIVGLGYATDGQQNGIAGLNGSIGPEDLGRAIAGRSDLSVQVSQIQAGQRNVERVLGAPIVPVAFLQAGFGRRYGISGQPDQLEQDAARIRAGLRDDNVASSITLGENETLTPAQVLAALPASVRAEIQTERAAYAEAQAAARAEQRRAAYVAPSDEIVVTATSRDGRNEISRTMMAQIVAAGSVLQQALDTDQNGEITNSELTALAREAGATLNGERVSSVALNEGDIRRHGLPAAMIERITQYIAARDQPVSGPLAEQLAANIEVFETLDRDGSRSVALGEVIKFFMDHPEIKDGNDQPINSWSQLETLLQNNNNQLPTNIIEQIQNAGRQ